MNDSIRVLGEPDLSRAFPLLAHLRPHLDSTGFRAIYEKAKRADAYRFVGLWEANELVGLMGVRELHDYVHGTHWYVDDLVTHPDHRSRGHGAALLRWLEEEAKKRSVACLRLSTGAQNAGGMRFYEREGWELRSHTYKKYPRAD